MVVLYSLESTTLVPNAAPNVMFKTSVLAQGKILQLPFDPHKVHPQCSKLHMMPCCYPGKIPKSGKFREMPRNPDAVMEGWNF